MLDITKLRERNGLCNRLLRRMLHETAPRIPSPGFSSGEIVRVIIIAKREATLRWLILSWILLLGRSSATE